MNNNGYSLPETISTVLANGTNIVKAFREKFGYSIEDLAVACGLTTSRSKQLKAARILTQAN